MINEAKAGGHYEIMVNGTSKNGLELNKASKMQLLIIGYRYFITKNSL